MFAHELKEYEKDDVLLFFTRDIRFLRSVPVLLVSATKGYTLPPSCLLKGMMANGKTGEVLYGYIVLLKNNDLSPEREVAVDFQDYQGKEKTYSDFQLLSKEQEKSDSFLFPLDEE